MPDSVTCSEARQLVLEATVAALIGQLPAKGMQEIAGMLAYLAEASEDAEAMAAGAGHKPTGYVSDWATQMLERIMVSRKVTAKDTIEPLV